MLRSRLDAMIDMRYRLAMLATRMPWAEIEASLAPVLGERPAIPSSISPPLA